MRTGPADATTWSAGYKADLVFGPDADYYASRNTITGGVSQDNFSVKQAYVALRAPVGYAFIAPFAGAVTVRRYQLIGGELRVDSLLPGVPFFPYVTLESADRRVIFRPGALDVDTEVIVKDGDRVAAGAPLFTISGEGASSWHTFYDRGVTANVIASVSALPSGSELDPVAFVGGR